MNQKSYSQMMHNLRIKTYPDGSREYLCAERGIFREAGWELGWDKELDARWWVDKADDAVFAGMLENFTPPEPSTAKGSEADNLARSKRRARNAVKDYALSNPDFCYFVTLTLDAAEVDRYDMGEVVRKLNRWADNHVRRSGLKYVLIPERHKDGAIHFHGFFNDKLTATDSGTLTLPGGGKPRKPRSKAQRAQWLEEGAHVVYNLPQWSLGYTTAIALYGGRRAAVGYVCKYITKAAEKIGGRWYYSGGALARPEVTLHDVLDEDFAALMGRYRVFVIPDINTKCVMWTVEPDGSVNE